MPEAAAAMDEALDVNLACFEVRGQLYAVPVTNVREIVRFMEITPLPNAPELIEGVIDLRGAVIPVMDLAKVLNRGVGDAGARARIVVLQIDGLVFGLWVDAATEVLSADAGQLADLPDLASQAGYDAVRHVVRRGEGQRPLMVLAPETLIENVCRSESTGRGDMGAAR